MATNYAAVQLKLRATIGDVEFDDVISYNATFAMNTIPQATITVAMGMELTSDQPATINKKLGQLKPEDEFSVYLTATVLTQENAILNLPVGETLIFLGKFTGLGYEFSDKDVRFTLHASHWLADLDSASAVSASMHPSNPADVSYPAVFNQLGDTGASAAIGGWLPGNIADLATDDNLSDLWGNILLPWMTAIASDTTFDKNLLEGPSSPNTEALAALKRMAVNPAGVPLKLNSVQDVGSAVASGICDALVDQTGANWINTTLWGKLVGEWATDFWFTVIPRVEDCLIVPFAGGLQGKPWAIIGTEDINTGSRTYHQEQFLRAVSIVAPVMWNTGGDAGMKVASFNASGSAGFFNPANFTNGRILIKLPPRWLTKPVQLTDASRTSTGGAGNPIGTANDPTVPNTNNPNAGAEADKKNILAVKGLMDQYAEQWYVIESLKGRVGEVSGKLRFDIAPGSNIQINTGTSTNLETDALQQSLFATVMQVSYAINAETCVAGTAFTLSHIRTQQENSQQGTSIASPALYTTAWVGAALLDGITPETT